MTYVLEALLARAALLETLALDLPGAHVEPLGQGLALIPMTGPLAHSLSTPGLPGSPVSAGSPGSAGDGGDERPLGFWRLPGGFDRVLADRSQDGPIAYAEAEYFGGTGEQRAAVWDAGALVLGPLHLPEYEPFPAEGSPLSQALRRLGATAGEDFDEFRAVGLRRHRHTQEWAGQP